ncbi:MAG: VOC family protein [Actinomycetota bacterium]|nr:VOC family protein [Actinomycetota bacterium]
MTKSLLNGFNHVATVTRDMDRLIEFYKEVFDAKPVFDLVAPGLELRHVGIDLGGAFLHAWEASEDVTGSFPREMFRRGRLDHVALAARDEESLEQLRMRLLAHGACGGSITDFGSILSVWFTDPDGMELEVCCLKEGADMADVRDPVMTTGLESMSA